MKNIRLWSVTLATAGILMASAGMISAAEPAASTPHQIGLIDMAFIFKNYDKFKDKTTTLQSAAEQAEAKAQDLMKNGQQLQTQLQTYQPGSPEYNKLEADLIKLKGELETFRQVEQREIVRKQADVYKDIYLEVQDIVNRYASHYNYTLVIRFNRQDVAEAGNPQAIIQNMNRQVVYYQPQDDITDPILKFLNDQYKKTASAR